MYAVDQPGHCEAGCTATGQAVHFGLQGFCSMTAGFHYSELPRLILLTCVHRGDVLLLADMVAMKHWVLLLIMI